MIQLAIGLDDGFNGGAEGSFEAASVNSGTLFVREACGAYRAASEAEVRAQALKAVASRMRQGPLFSSPREIKDYLSLQLGHLSFEVFGVLLLDAQHRLIADKVMFRGTLTQTSVYPREVVKEAIMANAAALVCYHNHPSGSAEPSRADELLTKTLKDAGTLVDVRVLDHFIVGGTTTMSFAERGLL